jgi:hypothetical protein
MSLTPRVFMGPELGLLRCDNDAIELRNPKLPLVDQLGRLQVPLLGTR